MKPFKITTMFRPLTKAELQLENPQWEDDDNCGQPYAFKQRGAVFCGKTAGGKRGMR